VKRGVAQETQGTIELQNRGPHIKGGDQKILKLEAEQEKTALLLQNHEGDSKTVRRERERKRNITGGFDRQKRRSV